MTHVVFVDCQEESRELVGRYLEHDYARNGKTARFDRWTLTVGRSRLLSNGGDEIGLSPRELKLLEAFLERPGEVLTREQLLELTAGRDTDVFDRCIDSQIRRLRRKIERDPTRPAIIRTHWRRGYRFAIAVRWELPDAPPRRQALANHAS